MGGSSSTHKVTFTDSGGVIQVSEGVARRLSGEEAPVQDRPTKAKEVPNLPEQPKMNSLEQKQLQIENIKKVDMSWQERVNELEKQNSILYQASRDKFEDKVHEVEKKYINSSCAPVCPEMQDKVLKCYKDNMKTPLECSKEVKMFAQCVDQLRSKVLTAGN